MPRRQLHLHRQGSKPGVEGLGLGFRAGFSSSVEVRQTQASKDEKNPRSGSYPLIMTAMDNKDYVRALIYLTIYIYILFFLSDVPQNPKEPTHNTTLNPKPLNPKP